MISLLTTLLLMQAAPAIGGEEDEDEAPAVASMPSSNITQCLAKPSDVCFSPGNCDERLAGLFDSAGWSVEIMIYAINRPAITAAIARAAKRGVRVRVLLDHTQAGNFKEREQLRVLTDHGVVIARHHHAGIMHAKLAVIDGRMVEFGSYNWTDPATTKNDEVMMILDCPPMAQKFQAEFEPRWSEARAREGIP